MKKENISIRLKKIMALRGLRQVDILKMCEPICKKYNKEYNLDIQIKKNDLSQWISGLYEPSQRKLTILAETLGVSETWLMGYDVPMDEEDEKMRTNFSLSLYELSRYCQLDRKKLSELTGIKENRINEFIHKTSLPTDDEINKIIDIFSLSNKSELFDGTVTQRIIKKYEEEGNKLVDKYKFGLEFESMLVELSKDLNIPLEKIKTIIFDRTNNLTILGTYNDLYEFLKRILNEKINNT